MPLIARRGSISSRAYGQLRRSALNTVKTYGGVLRFDNNNDVSLFLFTRTDRLAVSPFTTVSTLQKYATTNDLSTWTEYTSVPGPTFPWWGTGQYHVTDSSYRPWVQTYLDTTVVPSTDPGNVYTQQVSIDGLTTWTKKPNNLYELTFPKTSASLTNRVTSSNPMAYGDTIWRNLGVSTLTSGTANNIGLIGPRLVRSTDGGTTYSMQFDTTGRMSPLRTPTAVSTPKFGNFPPYISWSGSWNNYQVIPVGIWDSIKHPTLSNKYYVIGSGGTLAISDGSTATNFTVNQALLNTVGKHTWLYKIAVSGDRILILGWGTLPADYSTGTQRNFAVSSTDNGVTWTLSTSSTTLTTIFSQAWDSAFNRVVYAYDDGTKWYIGAATTLLATSTDGVIWTANTAATTAGSGRSPSGGIAKNGNTILIGLNSNAVLRSADNGVTWAQVSMGGVTASVLGVAWNGTRFVAVTDGTGGSYTSIDGSAGTWSNAGNNWDSVTGLTFGAPGSKAQLMVASGGVTYAIVQNQRVLRSTNGLSWTLLGSNNLNTLMTARGLCVRVMAVFEGLGSAGDVDLYTYGDWGCSQYVTSTDSGATWGAWNSDTNMSADVNIWPPLNSEITPVMTPLIKSPLTISSGGSGYLASNTINVRFSPPDNVYGWEPIVQTVTVSAGSITSITLFDSGAGYTTPPTVTITDAGASPGAGAVVTTEFVKSSANALLTMNRVMYFNHNKETPQAPNSTGNGWYGTNPLSWAGNTTGATGLGNLTHSLAIIKNSADVVDASASFQIVAQAGVTSSSNHVSMIVETDVPGIMHTTPFCMSAGPESVDGATRRIFQGNYNTPNTWGWSRPVVGGADFITGSGSGVYVAGKMLLRPAFFPVYDANIPSIPGATPGIAYYVVGTSYQTVQNSSGSRLVTYSPWVRTYAYVPASGEWVLINSGALPAGPWDLTLDPTSNQLGFSSGLNVVSNGTDPSNKATTVIVWSSLWRPHNNFATGPSVYPIAFITTNSGVSWSEHTALTSWMSTNGYLLLNQLTWNNNEGKWVMLMSKIAPNASQTAPFDTVITADFVNFTVKPNTDTVNIPTT